MPSTATNDSGKTQVGRGGPRGFAGLKVLSLESRRATEMAKLIANFGGIPVVVPSMREVPLESNEGALKFAVDLLAGHVDMVVFLTGEGTRILARVIESSYSRHQLVAALGRVTVIARGPKPVAALRELGVSVAIAVPEPNTSREMLKAIDERGSLSIRGETVAIQEYGSMNQELLDGFAARGARVMSVPVYEWQLPEDLEPLRAAVRAIARGEIDVMLFTTSVQVRHLMGVARDMGLAAAMRRASRQSFVASIGPVTSAELRSRRLAVDLEPSHLKMGILVKEAADHSAEIILRKKSAV